VALPFSLAYEPKAPGTAKQVHLRGKQVPRLIRDIRRLP
jgi:hypothetical protein